MTKKRVQHKLDSTLSGGKASKILKIEEVDSKTNVELELEDLLFGNGNFNADSEDEVEEDENEAEAQDSDDDIIEDETGDKVEDSEDDDDDLFFVDEEAEAGVEKETAAEAEEDDDDDESEADSDSDEEEVRKLPQSVWQDSDDEESEEEIDVTQVNRLKKLRKTEDETSVSATEYELRLRDQFEKLNPKPLWAQGKILQEDGEEVFRDGHSLLEEGHTSGKLESGTIDIQKLSDVTINSPSKGRITFTKFHPTSNSHIIVGASDHTIKLFEINGKQNPHIHTIKFKDLSPEFGQFYNSGKSILTTGYRKHYYTVDVETNQTTKHNRLWGHEGSIGYFELSPNEEHVAMTESNGVINIVDTQNMMKLGNFKTNSGGCVSMKWSKNSNYLYSLTVNGTVYKWDLRTYRCVQMFNDEGGYKSSHLGLSEEDQYMSIGSQSGFVNLYDVNSLQGQKPLAKPVKSFDNLTSTITSIAYNHDSQLMCMGSSTSKNQVRLVHLPSRKVYSNWPNPNEGGVVYKPTSIEFSPNSAYLTIGNNMGKVNLFRLNYYKAV